MTTQSVSLNGIDLHYKSKGKANLCYCFTVGPVVTKTGHTPVGTISYVNTN